MKINVSVEKDGKKIITKGIHIDETKIDGPLSKAVDIGMGYLNKTVLTGLGLEAPATPAPAPAPAPAPVAPPATPAPVAAPPVVDDKLYEIVKEKVAQEIKRVEDAKVAAAQPATPPQAPPAAPAATPAPVTPPPATPPPAAPKDAPAAPPAGDAK